MTTACETGYCEVALIRNRRDGFYFPLCFPRAKQLSFNFREGDWIGPWRLGKDRVQGYDARTGVYCNVHMDLSFQESSVKSCAHQRASSMAFVRPVAPSCSPPARRAGFPCGNRRMSSRLHRSGRAASCQQSTCNTTWSVGAAGTPPHRTSYRRRRSRRPPVARHLPVGMGAGLLWVAEHLLGKQHRLGDGCKQTSVAEHCDLLRDPGLAKNEMGKDHLAHTRDHGTAREKASAAAKIVTRRPDF